MTKRQRLPTDAIAQARRLRVNTTEPERRLWRALRAACPSARFRRQVPLGPYFVDFCSHAARLIIEVDGDTHAATSGHDAERTRFLEDEGYRVMRFTNADVMQTLEGVIATIAAELPSPLVGEGGAQRRMRGNGEA